VEYGFKASFLEDHLVFTTGGYYINRDGIKATVKDLLTAYRKRSRAVRKTPKVSKSRARGASRIFYARRELRLREFEDHEQRQHAHRYRSATAGHAGRSRDGGRHLSNSGGWLNGLSVHLKIGYSGRAYPFSTQTTFQRTIVSPGYYTVDPGLTYALRSSNGVRQSFRLSARNVLDVNSVTSDFNLGARRAVLFSYTLAH